jgi:hypothetical protein
MRWAISSRAAHKPCLTGSNLGSAQGANKPCFQCRQHRKNSAPVWQFDAAEQAAMRWGGSTAKSRLSWVGAATLVNQSGKERRAARAVAAGAGAVTAGLGQAAEAVHLRPERSKHDFAQCNAMQQSTAMLFSRAGNASSQSKSRCGCGCGCRCGCGCTCERTDPPASKAIGSGYPTVIQLRLAGVNEQRTDLAA